MADEEMCPNCSTPMQSAADAFVPISAGFREISFPVHIYECQQCHLVQLYAPGATRVSGGAGPGVTAPGTWKVTPFEMDCGAQPPAKTVTERC
jgi:hypothetical protein